jgi:branched-subunit amino acid aminotransferase/4-amino-4-deoxychorismate lyase
LLKFLTSVYVLTSFFGIRQEATYKDAGRASLLDYNKYAEELKKYNFNNIDDYIRALSEMKILPGITKYHLIAKIYRFLSVAFLPALEDIGRYTSIFMTSSIPGTNIIPRFLEKYNEDVYADIINISKLAF